MRAERSSAVPAYRNSLTTNDGFTAGDGDMVIGKASFSRQASDFRSTIVQAKPTPRSGGEYQVHVLQPVQSPPIGNTLLLPLVNRPDRLCMQEAVWSFVVQAQ
jgi:hypothetical protein